MNRSAIIVSALALTLVACTPSTQPQAPAAQPASLERKAEDTRGPVTSSATAAPSTADSAAMPSNVIEGVSAGMPYAAFRSKVTAQGWRPKPDPECLSNVVGANFKEVCAANASLCRPCTDMPELSSYSGDGQLLAYFEKPSDGRVLEVGGAGDLQAWNRPGHEADLQATSWTVQDTK